MRDWLITARKGKGLNQQTLARLAGTSQAHISKLEQGNRQPSVSLAKKIAQALEVDWMLFYQ